MKILILGSNGMAGHMLVKYLKHKKYSVTTAARSNAEILFDIEDTVSLKNLAIDILNYDYVINCTGLLVKESVERPDKAILINSWFPNYLSNLLKDTHIKLIHLSTDCVFDGLKGHYLENDPHTETNMYGKSKSFGEINNQKDITFRMSIIGPELKNGSGLFNFVANSSNKQIFGWNNAWWNGITTLQLSKCIEHYLHHSNHSGIYHLVNNDVYTNKYELVKLINEIFNFKSIVNEGHGPKDINKILINSDENRYSIPNYQTQLMDLKNFYS